MSLQPPYAMPHTWMIMFEQTGMHIKRVLVVDQDAAISELIAELLKSEGFAPLCYSAWPTSVAFIEQTQANMLILELGLGDPSAALDLLGELRRNFHTRALPVIVNSTDDRLLDRLAEPLRDLGCVMLRKPFELDDFFSSISACLDTGRSQMQRLAC
jgi:DNA-binding response OmpR family regulator